MADTNGSTNGGWKIPTRDLVLLLMGLVPGIGGYAVMQYRVSSVEIRYVSHEELATEVATALGTTRLQNKAVEDLAAQAKANSDKLDQLVTDTTELRQEWSHYRSRR